MGDEYRSVKGTRDLLPPETGVWDAVERVARRVFASYGYGEIRTPALEDTELFVRSVGAASDIVGKEMYSFTDRKGRNLSLRPEGTAPVARAFVQHRMQDQGLPVRLFYIGPFFRYERPQKGRYRQFHQIGAELLGDPGPWGDVEILLLLVRFLAELGFEDLTVLLNTVGDGPSRAAYREALEGYFGPRAEELSADSRRRLETNPLRILDSKDAGDRSLLAGAPSLEQHLNEESRSHFLAVRHGLDACGVRYRVEPRLVRGLDYYSRTVFEIVSESLGAQDAIVGGGRYDELVGELGGAAVPAIGFAIGQDRLVETLPEAFRGAVVPPAPVYLVALGEVDLAALLALAEELRAGGVAATAELGERRARAALKHAARLGCRHVVLLGDEELAAGEATLKDLTSGEQRRIARGELVRELGGEA